MKLEQGQYINDGEKDWLVCATINYKDTWYVYLIDEKNNEPAFYEVNMNNGNYTFLEITQKTLIKELILAFAEVEISKKSND